MPSSQFGGEIGPFLDNVQQRGVSVVVSARVDYVAPPGGDPAQVERDMTAHLLNTIRSVIGQKMTSGQLQFRNLGEGTLGTTPQEIIQASGLAAHGLQIGNLAMQFGIDGRPPYTPPAQAQAQIPNVRAHVHVGGFNVNASTHGGVDVGGLANQAMDKAKSAFLWWAIGGLLTLAIVGGVGWYIKHTIKKAVAQSEDIVSGADIKWDGSSALTCTGSQNLTFKGVTAKLSGTGVTATGSCTLTLVDCNITADTALDATGSAVVTITGGSLTGSAHAVQAMGSAKVTLAGTKVSGKLDHLGSATITGP